MPFGTGNAFTHKGKAITADRVRGTPATYTSPPKWLAAGVGATGAARTAAAGDTALSSELTEGRAVGVESTPTTSQTGDTYQSVGSITMTGSRNVDEAGMFDQLASGGNLYNSATFPVLGLLNGDTLQLTGKVQYQ